MVNRKGSDIRDRSFEFAVAAVGLVDVLENRGMSARIIARQFVRSAGSIGANLEEAEAAQSRADFVSKCGIALKEARETHYWLRLLARTGKITNRDGGEQLLHECDEIIAILTTIVRKARSRA